MNDIIASIVIHTGSICMSILMVLVTIYCIAIVVGNFKKK